MKKNLLFLSLFILFGILNQTKAQKNITLRSHYTFASGIQLSNIGGYVDSLGNEYALVGESTGLSIIDVTDPDNPFFVKHIPGPNSIWREVKTWQKYAYVTTEGGSQGLQIVNLSSLPDTTIPYHNYAPVITTGTGTYTLSTIHALHIDDGYVYLYGANNGSGIDGAVIIDLADPWNPVVAGVFDGQYVHDGYVRNDTLWACHIYDGFFSAIDVSDKANPVQLMTQNTPRNFTHNSWLSDNSRYLYTTDEVNNSYLAVYDVADVFNITEVDKIFSQNPGGLSVVHNTHIQNDYAVTSWYTDGVVITDGHRPQNLVHVGWYDTSPLSGTGMNGCWGVYPFLPSGTLVASDMQQGLYVLTPDYVRACYLEGTITDSICGAPLNNIHVTCVAAGFTDSSNVFGEYKTGTPDPGTYNVTFSKPGYISKTITGVNLSAANVTILDVAMVPVSSVSLNGNVNNGSSPLNGVPVSISNPSNSYTFVSDANGNFNQCGLVSGTYDITAGNWGYQTYCSNQNVSSGVLNISLSPAYYDDFALNYGWTVSGTATAGVWERAIPLGTVSGTTQANPDFDATGDCLGYAYVTGNDNSSVSADDVDGGTTILTSPQFDLSSYNEPHLLYSRWFYNGGGTGSANDSLVISISNGTQNVVLETVTASTPLNSTWVAKDINLSSLISASANMHVMVRTADANPGHLVEAGFDYFRIVEYNGVGLKSSNTAAFRVYPNPADHAENLNIESVQKGFSYRLTDLTGKLLASETIEGNKCIVSLDKLESGVYLLSVKDANDQSIRTIKVAIK